MGVIYREGNTIGGGRSSSVSAANGLWNIHELEERRRRNIWPSNSMRGLIFYLDASQTQSYSGSGTIWNDLSGNGNNGTLINGPTFSSSNNGNITFDGVNDYVSVTENINMRPQILTVEFAAKITSTTNTGSAPNIQYIIFRQNTRTSAFEGYNISFLETNSCFYMSATQSGTSPQYTVIANSNTAPIGTISIVTAVFDSTAMSIYVNGVFQNSGLKASGINYNSTHTLKIGRSVAVGSTFDGALNGSVYFVKIYNRALTSDEILQNYNNSKEKYGL